MTNFFKLNTKPKYSQLLILLFLSGLSLWAMSALFHTGFYTSHDGWHQVARLYNFTTALKDGQLPPRWSGGLLNGFGYPLFIFSYHLPWWIASPFYFLGMNIFDSIKIVFVITYLLSGITMYFFVKDLWGKLPAVVAACVYLLTPYRFATIIVRANIGEAVSFAVLPLLFWGIYKLKSENWKIGMILGSLGVLGAVLSHVMVLFLFSIPLFLFFLIHFIATVQKRRLIYVGRILSMCLLGFGLSAYYLLPALFYRQLTVFTSIYRDLYKNHWTPLAKLLYSPWGYGAIGTDGEMSRQVGLILWLVLGLALTFVLYRLIRRKIKSDDFIAAVFVFSMLGAIFMMTKSSQGIWKFIEQGTFIDFPWRFLSVTTFCGSLLSGYLIRMKSRRSWVLVAVLLLGVLYSNRNHMRVNQYTDIPLSLYVVSETTTNTDDEYLPTYVSREATKRENIERIHSDVQVKIEQLAQTSREISFTYDAGRPAELTMHHMFFPGMIFFVDGKTLEINKNDSGAIRVQVPSGLHEASLIYKSTSVMKLGNLVTFASIIILGVTCMRRSYRV